MRYLFGRSPSAMVRRDSAAYDAAKAAAAHAAFRPAARLLATDAGAAGEGCFPIRQSWLSR